jgi:ABC-type sugar transport system ATPase subunit
VLGNNPRIIVMDEPTSALSREEVERLFCIIRTLKEQNIAIIYISHHLNEIFSIADRVTVLRDGRRIATKAIGDVTPEELAHMMVGKTISEMALEKESQPGSTVLEVKSLTRFGFFHDVSFAVREGEIVGIAGLTGSGRTELMRSVVGLDPVHSGKVLIRGRQTRVRSYARAINSGLVYLTEDRKTQGLFLRLQVDENIISSVLPRLCRMGMYLAGLGNRIVKQIVERLQITPNDPTAGLVNLSGGNQQKVLLGKWLATNSSLYVLDEPTRGVDVGAKAIIHKEIAELTRRRASVILVSSDIPELVVLSDRVIVMQEGKIMGELKKEMVSEKNILLAISGQGGQYVSQCL